MSALRTLADVRRLMQVGTVVQVTNHFYPELSGERRVLRSQTKQWCMTVPESHPKSADLNAGGSPRGSWLDIPKATNCVFNGDSVTILEDGEPFVTITFPSVTWGVPL